jgi:DNA (cytosine-5)-methyltransferase 3A
MRILSLFDGVSCARVALNKAGLKVDKYYASEIDKHAIKVAQARYPDTIHVGDVVNYTPDFQPDLLAGGSPCQNLSIAGNRTGLVGDKSKLFWEFVRIRDEAKPKFVILENVASMKRADRDKMSEALGSEPTLIDASLVSAQTRKRLFWVGKLQEDGSYKQVERPKPEVRGIFLKDILEESVD